LLAPDLHHVGSASLAISTQMRQVAPEILQAKINLEAQQSKRQDIATCCKTSMAFIHTRTVGPQTLLGEECLPILTS
jgi:hypothetical protein